MPIRNKLRPFTDGEARVASSEPGAYELVYKDTVVYIGSSSTSIRSRIVSHRKRKDFMKVTGFRCQKVEWGEDAETLEAKLGMSFRRKNGGKLPRLQKRIPKYRDWYDL